MTRKIIIVDCETTSLEPEYPRRSGIIWELGLIEYGAPGDPAFRREHLWRMRPEPALADEGALAIGRFYERTASMPPLTLPGAHDLCDPGGTSDPQWSEPLALAKLLARTLDDATLVASAAHFDAMYLRAFLRFYGEAATWHHRLRDVCSMSWAWLTALAGIVEMPAAEIPPFDADTAEFAVALGIDPGRFTAHSGLGDCRLNAAMLDVITGAS